MDLIRQIREKFGLSQSELAIVFSCSRSFISMCEINDRCLPAKNMQMLVTLDELVKALAAEAKTDYNIAKLQDNYRYVKLQSNHDKIIQKISRMERELEKMNIDNDYCTHLVNAIHTIANDLPEEEKDEKARYGMLEVFINSRKRNSDIIERTFLELEIKVLKYEAEQCKLMAAALENSVDSTIQIHNNH